MIVMKTLKSLLMSFLVGGCFAVLGQLLFKMVLLLVPSGFLVVGPVTLAALGAVCGILWIFGIEQKIEEIGEYGSILHFGSCATAVARTYQESREAGKSVIGACLLATEPVYYVCGIGTLSAGIMGLLLSCLK